MSQVTHVVFDLGKVLVNFSYSQLLPFLRRRGALVQDVEDFATQINLIDYEHGRISTEEFLQRINALLSAPLDETTLRNAWSDIFSPLPQMLNLARHLKKSAQVFILSNTGEIHWQYLEERFALSELCHDRLASCDAGHMKPAAEIYQLAEKRFGFTADTAVFIDDRLENVEGARACGWQAIHHQSYGQTCDALKQLGLLVPQ